MHLQMRSASDGGPAACRFNENSCLNDAIHRFAEKKEERRTKERERHFGANLANRRFVDALDVLIKCGESMKFR